MQQADTEDLMCADADRTQTLLIWVPLSFPCTWQLVNFGIILQLLTSLLRLHEQQLLLSGFV